MELSKLLEQAISWFAWLGLALFLLTLISFLIKWGIRFRLVGATVFSFLLSASLWAFTASYAPPVVVDGAKYVPIVYDNGYDLVVAQAQQDFPNDAIKPSLEQIAGNLKGGGRNGALVHVRIRKLENLGGNVSQPIIVGEVIRDIDQGKTVEVKKTNEG